MRILRILLLMLIAMVPLITLFHFDFNGRLETQHSAMAAPDEFSYLLMAQQFLQGGGLSLQESLGRDTFYPPGYPLLLAAFAKITGGMLTTFKAHILNTLLLSLNTITVYFFTRRIVLALATSGHRRFLLSENAAATLALLIAALFATNWHVLETSLFVMSEPAFMLVVFLWLMLTLRWPTWHLLPIRALPVAALAVAAWSIRGAGITCVAATVIYPIATWIYDAFFASPKVTHCPKRRSASLFLVLLLPFAYQIMLTQLSPEKSIASAQDSANSYPRQLLNGITDGNRLLLSAPAQYPAIVFNLLKMTLQHLNDFASSFVPWPRENPDMHFREITGKIFALLALAGWLFYALRGSRGRAQNPPTPGVTVVSRYRTPTPLPQSPTFHFLNLFLLLYICLYLIWPFDFARFWSPILPIMLAFAADAVLRFLNSPAARPRIAMVFTLLTLLLIHSAEEDAFQLGNYARRLNYVSDSIADAARAIVRRSPDPQKTIIAVIGGDDHFTLAWYLGQITPPAPATSALSLTGGYRITSPIPHLPEKSGKGERADDMLLRLASEAQSTNSYLFFFSYFPTQSTDVRDTLESVRIRVPEQNIQKIFQKEIIASVWQIRRAQTNRSADKPAATAP